MSTTTTGIERRGLLVGAGAAIATSGLARPAIGQGSRRTLRFRPLTDLASVDTISTPGHSSVVAAYMVYDTLYGMDASLTPQPQMAAGHEQSDDGLTWRFTLRDGLLFHDGEKVRAQDAIASIARWSQREPVGGVLRARTVEMRAVSDMQFEIRLKKPFPHMLFALAGFGPYIMPERVAGTTEASTPIKDYTGSGPFVFLRDEWISGSRATFRCNERYVPRQEKPSLYAGGKAVNFDRVEWITLPDPATTAAALRNGEIDWWERTVPDLADQLRRSRGVVVERTDPFGVIGQFVFNNKLPPFNNGQLRHALLYTVDQLECASAVVGDHTELLATGVGLFPPGTTLATDAGMDVLTRPRDMELARQKVRESGYKGELVRVMVPMDQFHLNVTGTVMSQRLREAGLAVEVQYMDWATLVSRRNQVETGGWNCYVTDSNGFTYATPATQYRLIAPVPDPKLVALREAWYDAPDLAAQKQSAEQLQLRFIEEPPFLPLGQYIFPTAHRASVTDIVHAATTVFWGARKS